MTRRTLRTRLGIALSALALCSGGPGAAPALATMARWTELGPPTTLGPVVYDTRRHRALLINGHSIWSVSDGSSTWTKLWEGFHPPGYGLGFVYEPQRDRLSAFSTNDDATGLAGASVSYMELGAVDLAWTPTPFTGTAPYKLDGYARVFDPVRDRVVVFGGLRGGWD